MDHKIVRWNTACSRTPEIVQCNLTLPILALTLLLISVPTQKMPRLLTTSASAYRKLLRKAELMGIDTQALEIQEAQVAALVDVRKKWHIPAAFRCVTVWCGVSS
jgi:hypothetical protein